MAKLKRISLFVMHDQDATDYEWVKSWIKRWKLVDKLRIADYSSGGWEHYWDIEASVDAIAEVPANYLCDCEWSMPEILKKK